MRRPASIEAGDIGDTAHDWLARRSQCLMKERICLPAGRRFAFRRRAAAQCLQDRCCSMRRRALATTPVSLAAVALLARRRRYFPIFKCRRECRPGYHRQSRDSRAESIISHRCGFTIFRELPKNRGLAADIYYTSYFPVTILPLPLLLPPLPPRGALYTGFQDVTRRTPARSRLLA